MSSREYDRLLVDWRAPAARPFYAATPKSPEGVVRRRHIRTRMRRVLGIEDDLLDLDEMTDGDHRHLAGEGALLAALGAGRTGHMRDIVATIQAEQDAVIRSDLVRGPGRRRRPRHRQDSRGAAPGGVPPLRAPRATRLAWRARRRPGRGLPPLHRARAALARRDRRRAVDGRPALPRRPRRGGRARRGGRGQGRPQRWPTSSPRRSGCASRCHGRPSRSRTAGWCSPSTATRCPAGAAEPAGPAVRTTGLARPSSGRCSMRSPPRRPPRWVAACSTPRVGPTWSASCASTSRCSTAARRVVAGAATAGRAGRPVRRPARAASGGAPAHRRRATAARTRPAATGPRPTCRCSTSSPSSSASIAAADPALVAQRVEEAMEEGYAADMLAELDLVDAGRRGARRRPLPGHARADARPPTGPARTEPGRTGTSSSTRPRSSRRWPGGCWPGGRRAGR